MAVGGGSGGHVTPVVAVFREIKSRRPKAEIRFWCDFKFSDQARSLLNDFDPTTRLDRIVSGKLRRYHHLTVFRQLVWPKLVLLNIRDSFLVGIGFIQSIYKLLVWRPDVIFAKGGYVCLPVGLAAKILGIPLVIHDSDAYPGLTSRILSKWAVSIATGAPLENYDYPTNISRYIGIPISAEFHLMSQDERVSAKKKWDVDRNKPLIVITGGGLGAKRINDAVVEVLPQLTRICSVILVGGTLQYDELRALTPQNNESFQLYPFISEGMASLLGAADIVIARAGATTILELAALHKPTILIPNAKLTGGHQIKNAQVYTRTKAVEILDEGTVVDKPDLLVESVSNLLTDKARLSKLANNIADFARPQAASDMVDMIIDAAG